MTSSDLTFIKLGAAGKQNYRTLTVPEKREMIGGLKMVKAAV